MLVQTVQKIVKFPLAFLDLVQCPSLCNDRCRMVEIVLTKLWSLRSWCCSWTRLLTCPRWPRHWVVEVPQLQFIDWCVSSHGYDELMRRLFRAVFTGTRPGLISAIRVGKGWRGRRELAPRCSATQLGACIVGAYGETHVVHKVRSTTTTTPHHTTPHHTTPHHTTPHHTTPHPSTPHHTTTTTTRRLTQTRVSSFVTVMFRNSADGLCADRAHGSSGSAKRRRERQLRAFHRHEAMSVKLELATALHHSAQRVEVPREVEEYATFVGPRAQKTPPPGMRPDRLLDVFGPQEQVQRSTMEQVVDYVPVVSLLDAPAPQMVDKLEDVLKIVDLFVPAQVIEVPRISSPSCPPPRRVLPVLQTAEQLVDVQLPAARFLVRQWIHDSSSLRRLLYLDPLIDSRPALICFRFQRTAWSSVVHVMRQSMEFRVCQREKVDYGS